MPIVPFTKGRAGASAGATVAPAPPPLDWGLIAAAQMHSEGRLVEKAADLPQPEPK